MRALPALLGTFIAAFAAILPLKAESLLVTLSSQRLAITSNYTGAQVVVFGVVEDASAAPGRDYAAIITVRGPLQEIVVREKAPVGPMWLNRAQEKFAAPAFIEVLASRPLSEIAPEEELGQARLGLEAMVQAPDFAPDRGPEQRRFREALLRLKTRERLFAENEKGVTFLNPRVFRGTIQLPATAPPGDYNVEVALFSDGEAVAREQSRFELVKSGFEQSVAELARDHALLYGLGLAALSLMLGWIASVIFRRD